LFWEVLSELSQEHLFTFYRFCTGLTRVPIDGFKSLQGTRSKLQAFCIDNLNLIHDNPKTRLIEANTCFNRIYLPNYESKEEMKKNIQIIVDNDTNFFGNL